MNRRFAIAIVASLLGLAGILIYVAVIMVDEDEPSFADAFDAELVARGETVYQKHCAVCHGVNLEGQPRWHRANPDGTLPAPPHDDSGHTWHHSDEHLFQITKHGTASLVGDEFKSAMPVFAGVLSDREIWASLAFIKSRWSAEIQAEHARRFGQAAD